MIHNEHGRKHAVTGKCGSEVELLLASLFRDDSFSLTACPEMFYSA